MSEIQNVSNIRVFVEIEEDTTRSFVRLTFASPGHRPVTAGSLTLEKEVAEALVGWIEGAFDADVERSVAE